MATRKNFKGRRDVRRTEATERAAARAKRTAAEQIARLDHGGYVAKRERSRLEK